MEQIRLLVLRLTERCNLHCAYCYAAYPQSRVSDMDAETALRAVELCCPAGGEMRIQFTGGEPLLRLDVMEEVSAFGRKSGRKLRLSVQTNGTLLEESVCERLKKIGCAVGVSLDGVGDANRLRVFEGGAESFSAVTRGIQNLAKKQMRCGLNTVVTRENAAYLAQLPDLALWLGNVSGIGLDLFRPLGRGAENDFSADEATLRAGLSALKARTLALQRAGISFRLRELDKRRQRQKQTDCGLYCYAQTGASIAVDARGDIYPCSSLVGQREFLLGNLKDGLPECNHKAGTLAAPQSCLGCAEFALCRGGCPAGRLGGVNPLLCVMQQVLGEG